MPDRFSELKHIDEIKSYLAATVESSRLSAFLEEKTRTSRFAGELTLKRKDGTRFPAELSISDFRDRDGRERTSITIRDVTERERMEDYLAS